MSTSTRDRILLAFQKNPKKIISGAALARQLGLSRASIWKQVVALKKLGLPLEGSTRTGYHLSRPFDLSLWGFKQAAGQTCRFRVRHEFRTDSTQKLAKQAAALGAPEGYVWIAETQAQGRGRLERRWESPAGGLWFSLLLRPALPAARLSSLALVTSLALAEAVEEVTDVTVSLKWPNDLMVKVGGSWKKLAGILTEMNAEIDRTHWVVIGIGVNVNNPISSALKPIATSVAYLTGKQTVRAKILKEFLKRFDLAYGRFLRQGFDPFQKPYWSRYYCPGQSTRLKTAQGLIKGKASGVDPHGALLVKSSGILKPIWEGEIVS